MKVFYEKKRNQSFHSHISHSLAFDAHMHESVEVIYLYEGTAHAFSGGQDFKLCAGDFFVVFPNSVHYYDNCLDNLAIVAIIPLNMLHEFRDILTSKALCSPVLRGVNSKAAELLKELINYDGKYKREAVRGIVLTVFSMIMEKADFFNERKMNDSTLEEILDFCESNYKEEISLKTVAAALNLSQSHISHLFTNKIRISFRDYINSLRLNASLLLLKQGELSITKIAYESGFGTIRTFNRAFRKKFGVSPRDYLKQNF